MAVKGKLRATEPRPECKRRPRRRARPRRTKYGDPQRRLAQGYGENGPHVSASRTNPGETDESVLA